MWFRDVIIESVDHNYHTPVVKLHHRYGMTLFIASEVMFFVAWFWAYFNTSLFPTEAIGSVWPPADIKTFDPWDIPLINTLVLLLSCSIDGTLQHSHGGLGPWLLGVGSWVRDARSLDSAHHKEKCMSDPHVVTAYTSHVPHLTHRAARSEHALLQGSSTSGSLAIVHSCMVARP